MINLNSEYSISNIYGFNKFSVNRKSVKFQFCSRVGAENEREWKSLKKVVKSCSKWVEVQ